MPGQKLAELNELPHLPQSLAEVAVRLLWEAAASVKSFAHWAARRLLESLGAAYVAFATAARGRWSLLAADGAAYPLPKELMAEALDSGRIQLSGNWIVVPLTTRDEENDLLTLHFAASPAEMREKLSNLERLAPFLRQAIRIAHQREYQQRRLTHLETVLQIASAWNQTHDVESLLVQIAEAARQLLKADRASIFLWDKVNQVLVGRPALGAPDGQLRLRDDRGVVGWVVHHGRPRRVDAALEPKAIDRHVDRQLHYQTRTILCVPLCSRTGEIFGAFEALNKMEGAFTAEDEAALTELAVQAAIALENAQDRRRLLTATRTIAVEAAERLKLLGESPAMEAIRETIRRVADTDLSVLITGENGTGKEVVAQLIHYLSRRREQPFIAVNCAAIPESLAESELFGHEKGAFTDAHDTRPGKFEAAAGGTLLLDEIGELSLRSQAKLLRVLEEKLLVRVGGTTPIAADVRVLAATNQNLIELVRAKRFREDLYYRLNAVTIDLPPLRERGEDVLLLTEHFLEEFSRLARRKPFRLTPSARKRLLAHHWPGNVRELRNLIERLVYLTSSDRIEAGDLELFLTLGEKKPASLHLEGSLSEATAAFQAEYIRRQLEYCGGNLSLAARRLGVQRSNLYRKMRQLGMKDRKAKQQRDKDTENRRSRRPHRSRA